MVGKKLFLSKVLYRTKLLLMASNFSGRRLVIFNYHRIKNDDLFFKTNFDAGVFGPTALQFYDQMVWLKENTEILTESDLIARIVTGKPFSRPSTMVTFDDGYIDNYTLAYPILKQLQIPALFFIPTQQINSRQLGWWDIIAYLIKRTKKSTILFNGCEVSVVDQGQAITFFIGIMKRAPTVKTEKLLIQLSAACDVALPSIELQNQELMSWDQIREMAGHGISMGSHTHTHRVLSTLSLSEQKEEMTISKKIIEDEISLKVHSISYPVGSYYCFTKDSCHLAAECGYDLGFSFNTGINKGMQTNPYNIKRISSESELEHFAALSSFPGLFAQ